MLRLPRLCFPRLTCGVHITKWQLHQKTETRPLSSVLVVCTDTARCLSDCNAGAIAMLIAISVCNAGATFQRLMDVVMSGLHLDMCLVYLDDIVVFSSTVDEHLERLVTVLERLRTAGLKLKPEKCSFMQRTVSFLGHVISGEGIATDAEKTRAVAEWLVPASLKELRSFLGLASYYRRFVRNFADIAAPLHALTKKDQPFVWTFATQNAFESLRDALTPQPILAMRNDWDSFILHTDACNQTIGAVLSQVQDGVERVVAYASRILDKREVNYSITRKALLAIVYSLKYFKQYLMGRHLKIRTDHAPLTWLRQTPQPVGQQARWLEIMEEYSCQVEHRPESRHGNADGLSRRPCTMYQRRSAERDQDDEQAQAVTTVCLSIPIHSVVIEQRDDIVNDHVAALITDTDDAVAGGWSLENLRIAQESDPDISCY